MQMLANTAQFYILYILSDAEFLLFREAYGENNLRIRNPQKIIANIMLHSKDLT